MPCLKDGVGGNEDGQVIGEDFVKGVANTVAAEARRDDEAIGFEGCEFFGIELERGVEIGPKLGLGDVEINRRQIIAGRGVALGEFVEGKLAELLELFAEGVGIAVLGGGCFDSAGLGGRDDAVEADFAGSGSDFAENFVCDADRALDRAGDGFQFLRSELRSILYSA